MKFLSTLNASFYDALQLMRWIFYLTMSYEITCFVFGIKITRWRHLKYPEIALIAR